MLPMLQKRTVGVFALASLMMFYAPSMFAMKRLASENDNLPEQSNAKVIKKELGEAIRNDYLEVLENACKNDVTINEHVVLGGQTVFEYAVAQGKIKAVELLLNLNPKQIEKRANNSDTTILMHAALNGSKDVVKFLLWFTIDKLLKDKWNQTAADWASDDEIRKLIDNPFSHKPTNDEIIDLMDINSYIELYNRIVLKAADNRKEFDRIKKIDADIDADINVINKKEFENRVLKIQNYDCTINYLKN